MPKPSSSIRPCPLQSVQQLRLYLVNPAKVLPHPHMFSNVRILRLHSFPDPAWLGRLGWMRQLEHLELSASWCSADQPPQPFVVGGISSLTSLNFMALDSMPPLCIALATLPSLVELVAFSDGGPVELLTASPDAAGSPAAAPSLQRLRLCGGCSAALDLSALPALTSLLLGELWEVSGASSIAEASSLRLLVLGGDPEKG